LASRGFAHDRNARVRIETYVMAWNAERKQEGQHQGPITAAYQRVLHALLWQFLSYKEGVFTWINRIDREAERVKDLFEPRSAAIPRRRRFLGCLWHVAATPLSHDPRPLGRSYMVLKPFQNCFAIWAWRRGGRLSMPVAGQVRFAGSLLSPAAQSRRAKNRCRQNLPLALAA
jgi:hypothetical protein